MDITDVYGTYNYDDQVNEYYRRMKIKYPTLRQEFYPLNPQNMISDVDYTRSPDLIRVLQLLRFKNITWPPASRDDDQRDFTPGQPLAVYGVYKYSGYDTRARVYPARFVRISESNDDYIVVKPLGVNVEQERIVDKQDVGTMRGTFPLGPLLARKVGVGKTMFSDFDRQLALYGGRRRTSRGRGRSKPRSVRAPRSKTRRSKTSKTSKQSKRTVRGGSH